MKPKASKMQFDGSLKSAKEIIAWSDYALEFSKIENKIVIIIPKKATAALVPQYANPTDWIIRTWIDPNCYFVCSDYVKKIVYKS